MGWAENPRPPKTTLISRLYDPSPVSCRVNPLWATTDFTQDDMLDGPSCGETMRTEGGQPQRRQQQQGLGLWHVLVFYRVSMVMYAVRSFIFPGSASSRTRCWCILIFRDTTVVRLWGGFILRFSEWIIMEIMMPSLLPGYFRQKLMFYLAVDFESLMMCSQRRSVAKLWVFIRVLNVCRFDTGFRGDDFWKNMFFFIGEFEFLWAD